MANEQRGGYGPRGYDEGRRYRGRPSGNDDDRGMMDRAGDEMMSWFGDEEAERRRRMDMQRNPDTWHWRDEDDDRGGSQSDRSRYGSGRVDPYGGSGGSRGSASYGASGAGGYGGMAYGRSRDQSSDRNTGSTSSSYQNDPHYGSWRERQMRQLDDEYAEYCRDRQTRFDSEYDTWRRGRQGSEAGNRQGGAMTGQHFASQIREHMDVVGNDDEHVGTVDGVEGSYVRLTKSDKDAKGRHHLVPMSLVDRVDDRVRLNCPADAAKREWQAQPN